MTTPNKAGIYIHIPFCVKKCNYCAFLSGPAGPEVRQEYVNHLIEEIRLRSREVPEADTIYFGGGTPSLLTPEQIGHILEEVRKAFRITEGAEVTLEANPGTLTEEVWQDMGTPVSIGFPWEFRAWMTGGSGIWGGFIRRKRFAGM